MEVVAPDLAAEAVLGVGLPGCARCIRSLLADVSWGGGSTLHICMPATGERDGLAPQRTKDIVNEGDENA